MKYLYYRYGMDYQHLYQKTFQKTSGTIGNGTDVTVMLYSNVIQLCIFVKLFFITITEQLIILGLLIILSSHTSPPATFP